MRRPPWALYGFVALAALGVVLLALSALRSHPAHRTPRPSRTVHATSHPSPHRTRPPAVTVTTRPTTVVIQPTPPAVIRPHPTVTKTKPVIVRTTKTAKPKPTHTPKPRPTPDPVKSCLKNLLHPKSCL